MSNESPRVLDLDARFDFLHNMSLRAFCETNLRARRDTPLSVGEFVEVRMVRDFRQHSRIAKVIRVTDTFIELDDNHRYSTQWGPGVSTWVIQKFCRGKSVILVASRPSPGLDYRLCVDRIERERKVHRALQWLSARRWQQMRPETHDRIVELVDGLKKRWPYDHGVK